MKILFIDDDKAPIRYYLEELKDAGFDVTHCRNPDEALDALEEEGCVFGLIILDSAMPPGKRYADSNTEEGLTTGNFLFRDIRERCPDTPILILTNFAGLDWIRKASECSNVCEVRKLDVMPFELVERVRQMIK
jgi:CheY-like chemotaxis protein